MNEGYNQGNAPPPPKYDNPGQPPISHQPYMAQQPQQQPPYGYSHPGYMQPQPSLSTNQQVTVNVNAQQPQPAGPRTWSTTQCGCMEDMPSCCCVMFFLPCYTCYLAPRLGESCCAPICLTGCGHSVPMVFRTKVRAAHGILGGAIDDCMNVFFCTPCVICQIKREIDYIEKSTGKPAF